MSGKRGQALIETAVFLPFVLVAMMAIIYFSQYGVLQGRAALAVRYAAIVSSAGTVATDTQGNFNLDSMYSEITREGGDSAQGDPGYPSSGFTCAGAGAAAAAAMNLQQAVPGGVGTAAPAPNYFHTDVGSAPAGVCTAANLPLPNGSLGLAASYMIVQYTAVSSSKATPTILQSFVPATQMIAATMAYPVPAAPASMMYCSQAFGALMANSFASLPEVVPNVISTPYGAYPDAPASPTPRPGC